MALHWRQIRYYSTRLRPPIYAAALYSIYAGGCSSNVDGGWFIIISLCGVVHVWRESQSQGGGHYVAYHKKDRQTSVAM